MRKAFPLFYYTFFLFLFALLLYSFTLSSGFYFLLFFSFFNFVLLMSPFYNASFYFSIIFFDILFILFYFLKFSGGSAAIFLPFLTLLFGHRSRMKKLNNYIELSKMVKIKIENMHFSTNEFVSDNKRMSNFIRDINVEISKNMQLYRVIKSMMKRYEGLNDSSELKKILADVLPAISNIHFVEKATSEEAVMGNHINRNKLTVSTRNATLIFSFSREISDNELRTLLFLSDIMSEIYENSKMIKRLKQLSIYDGLTHIYIRRQILKMLKNEINRSDYNGKALSVLMLDIDFFKHINDKYGHIMGDYVLRGIADTIKSTIREGIDLVGRYGGEEFLIVLPNTACADAVRISERIRETISRRVFRYSEYEVTATVSIGISQYRRGATIEQTIERSDQALYKAKETGRNKSEKNC